jgi:5-methylthioadenosine/S-adenosylhomocysteine deaminase
VSRIGAAMNVGGTVLVRGGTVVAMTSRGAGVEADVLVERGSITAVGAPSTPPDCPVLDARDALVLPGFVQAHVHVVQSLARHRAEGLPLLDWLRRRIWPYEAALSPAEVGAAARLGIAELLLSGTTCALDMGTTHDHDAVFTAAADLGIRFSSGKCLMDAGDDLPDGLAEDGDTALATSEELGNRWHGAAGGRLRYAVAPRFVLSCTARLLREAVSLATRHGWLIHTHASENPHETEIVRERTGMGNVSLLASLGACGENAVLAHCVHLDDDEFDRLAADRTGVVHCPGANLKLASGVADLPRLLRAGVRVGLGADGPPCNNRLSIFHEMALAATLHNLRNGAGAVDPWTVLELATRGGAELLGLGSSIGCIEPGRRGDLVVLEPGLAMEPVADPAAMIVFAAGAGVVRHVVVDGRPVVVDRRLAAANARDIASEARAAASAVSRRLGWS